ncbi:hypothetical protein [Kitasatospora sp. NPDC001175]|uniref:hypothetical protein n=1 Tax=Kitasatospora sp. NPDC001175 TaxID=3157103 RepID=UPI003D037C02
MPDISSLLDAATPRELAVRVCLDGAAAAREAELQAELDQLGPWQPSSLGETNPGAVLAEQIAAVRAEVDAATVEFRFRALGHLAFSDLLANHPPASGSRDLYAETFLPVLLAACCVSPTLSAGQVRQLLQKVNHGTATCLFDAALAVNEEPSPLPFS